METIHRRFPLENWMHVYKNSSKLDTNRNVRSGIYSKAFPHYHLLGATKSAFDGEVKQISVSLQHLNARQSPSDQAVILSDFQAAILVLANCSQSSVSATVKVWRSLLRNLHENLKTLVLQIFRFTSRSQENNFADNLENKKYAVQQTLFEEVFYRSVASRNDLAIRDLHLCKLKERSGG